MTRRLIFLVLLSVLTLQGCLGNKKKDARDAPLELTRIENDLRIQKQWSVKLGRGAEHLSLGLRPVSDGTRIFAASHSGIVSGIDIVAGHRDWTTDTDLALSAGPGYGNSLVVVGSADGDIVALEASNGVVQWTRSVGGEVLATPVIHGGLVIVKSGDGSVHAMDALDGAMRWTVETSVPRLTLRGSGQPAAVGDRVIVGFDNGQVVALSLRDGADLWRAPLALGRGRTELERMSDVDSNVVTFGEEVYVAGFQSRAALLSAASGQPAWISDLSSAGLDVGRAAMFSTSGNGTVSALDRATGTVVWEQKSLLHRGLTGPAVFGNAVVVGDFEGYLHWLSVDDGTLIARTKAGKASIVTAPMVVGNKLFVQDEAGLLHAFSMPAPRN